MQTETLIFDERKITLPVFAGGTQEEYEEWKKKVDAYLDKLKAQRPAHLNIKTEGEKP